MSNKRYLVIGSGMAGLLAAHAIEDVTGIKPHIYSNVIPTRIRASALGGVHILHDRCSIPSLPDVKVTNYLMTPFSDGMIQPLQSLSEWERKEANAAYGDKVYGTRGADTSIMRMPGVINGYDYVSAFNWLVDKYAKDVQQYRITETKLWRLAEHNDLIVYTAPRPAIVPKWIGHPFQVAWASNRPPVDFNDRKLRGNFVVYNPDNTQPWSRAAKVEGSWYTEYIKIPSYRIPDLRQIEKIRSGDAYPAIPDNVLLAGRVGKWEAGVLASDAYWSTVQAARETIHVY